MKLSNERHRMVQVARDHSATWRASQPQRTGAGRPGAVRDAAAETESSTFGSGESAPPHGALLASRYGAAGNGVKWVEIMSSEISMTLLSSR
eukprot:6773345-Prymnesium_polylepis.1